MSRRRPKHRQTLEHACIPLIRRLFVRLEVCLKRAGFTRGGLLRVVYSLFKDYNSCARSFSLLPLLAPPFRWLLAPPLKKLRLKKQPWKNPWKKLRTLLLKLPTLLKKLPTLLLKQPKKLLQKLKMQLQTKLLSNLRLLQVTERA